ncbi:YciY family protein [Pantoea sp. FN060301]|uniref:YciY family protein n=1 Tax=Pantoea sp. FN060301 TaxID=3420380 RepID=UPI003D16390F
MRRSRNEVARWRMSRQVQRRRARWLEAQSRRYGRMVAIRHQLSQQQRRSILFITHPGVRETHAL